MTVIIKVGVVDATQVVNDSLKDTLLLVNRENKIRKNPKRARQIIIRTVEEIFQNQVKKKV